MPSTTNGIPLPDPRSCDHCGKELRPLTTELCGNVVFCGWEPCACPGALDDQRRWEEEHEAAMRASDAAPTEASIERRIEAAGIPPRYRDATHEWAEHMANLVQEGYGFYVHGENGTKKTLLACSAGILCIQRGMTVRFEVATKLLDRLRGFDAEARALADQLAECDLLIVDDLGKEGAATPRAAEKLFDIFNDRYNAQYRLRRRPVIVTSNFPRGEVADRVSIGGAGLAIASRLKEMTKAFKMPGEDGRLCHGEDRHAA